MTQQLPNNRLNVLPNLAGKVKSKFPEFSPKGKLMKAITQENVLISVNDV